MKNPLCLCGYAYHGKKCKELIKQYPMMKDGDWHYPISERENNGASDRLLD